MQILAVGMGGQQIALEVEPETAFDALRMAIVMEIGLEVDVGLDLLLRECVLPRSSSLALTELGIVDGVCLTFVKRPFPRLLTAALDGTAKLWNSMTGECLQTFVGHSHHIISKAVFSSDGTLVLTVAPNAVKIWKACTG